LFGRIFAASGQDHRTSRLTLSFIVAAGCCAAVVPPLQIGAFTVNEKGWKAANPAHGGLIVTTSIHPDPCKKPHGDYVNQLSVMNKLDYVKLHGYEFHLATRVIDKSLPKLCALRPPCWGHIVICTQNAVSTTRCGMTRSSINGLTPGTFM